MHRAKYGDPPVLYIDGCPECVVHYWAPLTVEDQGNGVKATYHCEACGYRWFTGWSRQDPEAYRNYVPEGGW
jgi:hypothetical protein